MLSYFTKKTRIMCFVVVTLFSIGLLGGCGDSAKKSDTYRIAMVGPLTGNGAQYGQAYKATMEILRDKVNEEGGIDGKQIEIDFYDDKQDPKETLNVANKILADGNYVGVIGSQTSSCSMSAAPVLQKEGIPMISPQASHKDFTPTGDYIFSLQMPNSYEQYKQIEWMCDYFEAKKIAIIYSNDDWGTQCLEHTQRAATDAGAELVAAETFIPGQTKDFSPIVTKVREAEPDVVYLAVLYADGCLLVPQMKQLGLDCQIVSANTLYKKEFIDVVGDEAEGIYLPNPFSIVHYTEDYEFIEKAYSEKTGNAIDPYVTCSYDALSLLLDAIKEVGSDHEAIKNYLSDLEQYEGTSGTFTFDENGGTMKSIYVLHIENGEFVEMPDIVIEPEK